MKITSRLALSQLKRNKKRTAGSCLAIALSTALITAVMCFATSGIDMLRGILGDDFAEYGGAVNAMALTPALILMGLIAFMAFSVISNIFQASANNRVKELGILKCVGGTKKQIKKTVISEGLWLSMFGIPMGLILGAGLGFIGVKIAGMYIDQIVEITKSIIMRSFDVELKYSVRPYAFIIAAFFSFITVLISALKPAKQMSKITAVECVSFGNSHKEMVKKASGSRIWKVLWGFEGELGARNISRNKKSFKPAIRALSIGICLLLVTAGLAAQFGDMKKLMKSENNRLVVDYVSLRDEGDNPETGRRQDVILHPIDSKTYNEINDKLSAFGDFEVWGYGSNRETYYAKADESLFTDDMKQRTEVVNELGEMNFDMVSVTENLYRKICDSTDTEYGGNILINTYTYNDNGEKKEIVPFTEDLNRFELVTPDGETSSITINGFLNRNDMDEWLFDWANRTTVMVITPGADARYFDWYCEPGEQEAEFVEYARTVIDEYYPNLTDDAYVDQGYTTRISREDTMSMALNVMLVLIEVIMYGFVILLTLMGFAGFISTITANIRARSREFAVLKSVGMTSRAIKKMLYSESMYCTVKASIVGIVLGILIPWLINLSLRNAFPIRFHLPVYIILISVVITFGIVLMITHIEIKRMKGQSLIETIRFDSIR
jgi:putative ABC transport system permease protein